MEAVVVADVAEDCNIVSVRVYMEVMELLAKDYTTGVYTVGKLFSNPEFQQYCHIGFN